MRKIVVISTLSLLLSSTSALAGTRVENPPALTSRPVLAGTRVENPPALGGTTSGWTWTGDIGAQAWGILVELWGGAWLSRSVYGSGVGRIEPSRSP